MIGYSKAKQVGKREKSEVALEKAKGPKSEAKPKKRRKPMKKVSKKQDVLIRAWRKIVGKRIERMIEKFGCVLCEYCLKRINEKEVEGHHNDHRRINNTPENCRLVHPQCNTEIEDKNIKDVSSLL